MKQQIDELLEEQEKKLAELLRPNRYVHKAPSNPFTLKKQELFGEMVHARRIQFEWPTEKTFELMPDKDTLRVESLTFVASRDTKKVFSVQCNLSNGMVSPLFKSLMNETAEEAVVRGVVELPADR